MRALFICALFVAGAAIAQAPATVSQLYVSFALPGDTARKTATVILDAPLVLERDAAGRAHLKLTEWAGFGNCVTNPDGGLFCNSLNAGFTPIPQTMRNDVPVTITDVPVGYSSAWRLSHIVMNKSITCFRGGVRQTPDVDYFGGGDSMLSHTWAPGDAIACDYEWLPPAVPIHLVDQ
jgi:hypothetical protein